MIWCGGLVQSPYQTTQGAVIWAWRPGHWANWAFEVDNRSTESVFQWTRGGFQGARGNEKGAEWFIENVREELDAYREFFFNVTTKELFYANNASVAPVSCQGYIPTCTIVLESQFSMSRFYIVTVLL